MERLGFLLCIIIFSTSALVVLRRKIWSRRPKQQLLPPGPPGWPIFGNLFDLGSMPHRTLTEFRRKYGDVIWLKFGALNTMVILSSKAATDFFKNHDLSFAERKVTETMRAHDYHKSSLALAPYGTYWRVLRRLVTVDMLVTKRLIESAPVRRKCVDNLLIWIEKESLRGTEGESRGIHVGRLVFLTTFNLLGNLMLSRDLLDPESKDGEDFFGAMMGLMEWSGHANMADLFPILRRLDPQGLTKKMERDIGKALKIASKFINEKLEGRKKNLSNEKKKDFVDVLLDFEGNGKDEPAKISEKDLNIFILVKLFLLNFNCLIKILPWGFLILIACTFPWEIFLAGSETTNSTIEWALAELLNSPDSMNKAKNELAQVVGSNRTFEEDDIDNLPYLKAVIKETLRLHPPIPFLVPRRAIEDTKFQGYDIPKDTQVFVNAWAIGRDPEVWDEPWKFNPERFLGSNNVDYKGQNYELIPFGAGRRICAGIPLAHRMLNLILGSLLHQFDWELDGISKEKIDMNDRMGITVRKAEPLLVVIKRCK